MAKHNPSEAEEAQLQAAWERVLRGEAVDSAELDPESRASAEALRSFVIWEQLQQQPPPVDELAMQRSWQQGQFAAQVADQSVNKPAARTRPRWATALVAGVVLCAMAIPLWQWQIVADKNALGLVPDDDIMLIKKSSQHAGLAIYERIQVNEPQAFAQQLQQDLLQAGFQVAPLETLGDDYLLRLQAPQPPNMVMQAVLDRYDIILGHEGEANLRIGR